MSGHVGNLSPKQADVLEKFRLELNDVLKPEQISDDYFLTRWLRARNYDLKTAEVMLRNNCAWRKQHNVDRVLDDYLVPEVLEKYYPGGFMGVDKCGCPIWIERLGNLDMRGILRSARTKDITMTRVGYVSELFVQRNAEMTKKLGKRVDQVNIIVDLEKLGMRHMWKPGMNMFSQISSLFEQNYPEMLKRIYIVNSPKIFPITYKIAKPFLSEETSKKIHVLGANFKDMLLKDIDADQLPKFLGGTCTDLDGDPYCPSKICAGGDVPIEYYIKMEADEMENCKVAVVGRGSTLQIDCNITTSNSVIRWQFTTEGYDIGFGVYKKATGIRLKSGLMEGVLVSQRVNSHFVPEDGSLCCRNPGIYVVRFDNTYSWTRSKTIHYIIDVLEPETVGYYATSDDCDDIYTSTQQNGTSDAMNFFVPSEKIKLDEADSEGSHIEQGINIEQMHDSTANSADEGVQITRM